MIFLKVKKSVSLLAGLCVCILIFFWEKKKYFFPFWKDKRQKRTKKKKIMPHHLQNFKSFLTSHPCLHGWETKYFPLNHFWLSRTVLICHIPTSKESSNTLLEESCCRKLTRCYESSWQSCWPHLCKHPCIPLSQFNSLDETQSNSNNVWPLVALRQRGRQDWNPPAAIVLMANQLDEISSVLIPLLGECLNRSFNSSINKECSVWRTPVSLDTHPLIFAWSWPDC